MSRLCVTGSWVTLRVTRRKIRLQATKFDRNTAYQIRWQPAGSESRERLDVLHRHGVVDQQEERQPAQFRDPHHLVRAGLRADCRIRRLPECDGRSTQSQDRCDIVARLSSQLTGSSKAFPKFGVL